MQRSMNENALSEKVNNSYPISKRLAKKYYYAEYIIITPILYGILKYPRNKFYFGLN